jgi:hypothetical protein
MPPPVAISITKPVPMVKLHIPDHSLHFAGRERSGAKLAISERKCSIYYPKATVVTGTGLQCFSQVKILNLKPIPC